MCSHSLCFLGLERFLTTRDSAGSPATVEENLTATGSLTTVSSRESPEALLLTYNLSHALDFLME